jgi:DNA-binding transcriptional LysR family regulator
MMDEIDGRLFGGLVVLAAVAEARSFCKAGERLGMTQSGVSKAIAKLEARLGTKLIHRTSRAVELTEEGRALHDRVAEHLAGIGAAATATAQSRDAVRGRLRINVDPLFSRAVLSPKLSEFLLQHPHLELRIETRDRIADLVSDGFDLAVRFGDPVPSALIARRILEARILTVAAPSYIERHGKPDHPDDLASATHQCIHAIDPATGRPYDWEFRRGNDAITVAVNGRLTVTDSGTKLGACLAGFGIAQVIDLGLDQHFRIGTLINLFPDWSDERFPLYVYYASRNHLPAKVRTFIAFLVGALGKPNGTASHGNSSAKTDQTKVVALSSSPLQRQ